MNDHWRQVKSGLSWDESDALRAATLHDTPSLDVRLVSKWRQYSVEIRRPEK